MLRNDTSTLIRALKELDLATERINRERRDIVSKIEESERHRKRIETREREGRPKARHIAGRNCGVCTATKLPANTTPKRANLKSSKKEYLTGDRVFITNQVKSTSGHKAPLQSDRYATVRYQQVSNRDKVQVYFITDSGVKTYRLSTNVIHIGPNYSCYESGRSCYVARKRPDRFDRLRALPTANQLA